MKKLFVLFVLIISFLLTMYLPTVCEEENEITCQLVGNTGAVITAPEDATVSCASSLVNLTQIGSSITVEATSSLSGIASVDVCYDGETNTFDIPVGYTTFVFEGDSLTVIEGSSDKYEISGINSNNEEYLVEGPELFLPYTLNENGDQVFTNTDEYSINVDIKKKGGRFVFYGQSEDMSIAVKKEATADSYLYLCGLELKSSFTSPITVKKDSTADCYINACSGFYNKLTDSPLNDSDLYGAVADGGDGTNENFAESACIKGKDCADIIICGGGTLELDCVTGNAIKVNEYGRLTIEDLNLNINSASHGISCNNVLTINSGNISINAEADGIRCDPKTVDSTVGLASVIEINGGYIAISCQNDCIQSAQDIVINDGAFKLKSTGSKGIKAAYNGTEEVDTAALTQSIRINGGYFLIDTPDDAIHSDAYISITNGNFDIKTDDDAIHSDTTLELGSEDGQNGPSISIYESFEGLESGTVYIHSGNYYILASDDGINSAGGSDTTDPGSGGFNPGGHRPGKPGSQGNSDFAVYINGGRIFINMSGGDAIDSNGILVINGGSLELWGAPRGKDGEPLDADSTRSINGGTVLAFGGNTMSTSFSGSQQYISYTRSVSEGKTVNIINNDGTVLNRTALKDIGYVMYSSPNLTSSWTITADESEISDPHTHSYQLVCEAPFFDFYLCEECGVGYGKEDYITDDDREEDEEIIPSISFPDVKEGAWYYTAVEYCSTRGIFKGDANGNFLPNKSITRAEFVVVLANCSDEDTANEQCDRFSDVKSNYWYYSAMSWAANRGIVNGTSATTFTPNKSITRQELCLMLFNYLSYTGIDIDTEINELFVDDEKIASWARDAVYSIRGAGIVSGIGNNCFDPRGNATRAQVSQMMMQFYIFMNK